MAGKSSLNSRETSYIPIPEKDSKNHDDAPPQHDQHLLESKTKTVSESLQVETNSDSCTSSPLDVTELIEEDVNVAVEFLKMIFPAYGEQSIRDVYFFNCADLHDAIVMLNELEFDADESCETLDNNDNASEFSPAAVSASPKLNKFITHIDADV